jgi:cholesterol transport system auxiliary component
MKEISIAMLILFLSGCSLMHPANLKEANTYILKPEHLNLPKTKPTSRTLLVLPTEGNKSVASSGMIYVTSPYQQANFAMHRWIAPPAQMLSPLIMSALQESGHYRGVLNTPFMGKADLRLNTELMQLEQNFLTHPSRVKMSLSAELMDVNSEKIIATKIFNASVVAPIDGPYGGVIAANQATRMILRELVLFCVTH